MSYTKAGSSNVTMIEDLIDLDETNPSLSSNNILPNAKKINILNLFVKNIFLNILNIKIIKNKLYHIINNNS